MPLMSELFMTELNVITDWPLEKSRRLEIQAIGESNQAE
jgi:hypothetical protein